MADSVASSGMKSDGSSTTTMATTTLTTSKINTKTMISLKHKVKLESLPDVDLSSGTQLHLYKLWESLSSPKSGASSPTSLSSSQLLMSTPSSPSSSSSNVLAASISISADQLNKILEAEYPGAAGQRLTHVATNNSQKLVLRDLLKLKANIDIKTRNQFKRTALHVAVIKKDLEMVEFLLKCGADPNIREASGKTCLDLAGDNKRIRDALERNYEPITLMDEFKLTLTLPNGPNVNLRISSNKTFKSLSSTLVKHQKMSEYGIRYRKGGNVYTEDMLLLDASLKNEDVLSVISPSSSSPPTTPKKIVNVAIIENEKENEKAPSFEPPLPPSEMRSENSAAMDKEKHVSETQTQKTQVAIIPVANVQIVKEKAPEPVVVSVAAATTTMDEERWTQRVKSLEETIQQLHESQREEAAKYLCVYEEMERAFESKKVDLMATISEQLVRQGAYEQEIGELKAQRATLEENLNSEKEMSQEYRRELERNKIELLQQTIHTEERETLLSKVRSLEESVEHLEAQKEQTVNALNAVTMEFKTTEEQLLEEKAKSKEKSQKIQDLEEKIVKMELAVDSHLDTIQNLDKDSVELRATLTKLEVELQSNKNKMASMTEEIQKLKTKASLLEQEKIDLRDTCEALQQRSTSVVEDLRKKSAQIRDYESQLQQQKLEILTLQDNLLTSNNLLTQKDNQVYSISSKNNSLQAELSSLKKLKERFKIPHLDFSLFRIHQQVGVGAHGNVYRATYVDGQVAAKILRKETDFQFDVEVDIMMQMTPHPNILPFYGVTKGVEGERYIISEYAVGNGLDTFISNSELNEQTLLSIGCQVAAGLAHMHSHGVVHRDISARNVLVTHIQPIQVKIADFGLSRFISPVYTASQNTQIPFRYLPLESLIQNIYSSASDIWMFGVFLWEIFSRGETPWLHREYDEQFKIDMQNGMRLSCPRNCNSQIYAIMNDCWRLKPEQRPAAKRLVVLLTSMLPR